jgi:probable blue pigment (indigoidine) exporter
MDIKAILMGIVFAMMWSSAFTSARIIVADMSPLFALSLRYLISGLLGVGIALALGQSMRLTPAQWRATIVFGILQNAVYLGLNFVAMQTIQASLAAIIASTMPLIVGFAVWAFLGEKLKPLGLAGLVAGVIGVAIIMGARLSGGVDMVGVALCVVGVLALSAATLLVRGATSGGNFLMIVGLQMLVGCVTLAMATFLFETPRLDPSLPLLFAFTYTCLVPGLAATIIWFWLVNRVGSEPLGARDILGVVIIAAGILAVQISRQGKA